MSGNGQPEAGPRLELTGVEGLLKGHRVHVTLGGTVVVGRSRSCDLSTRRSRAFLKASEESQRRILADPSFLKVSRRHVQVTYHAEDQIEIRDLSKNGTFVDDRRVDRLVLSALPGMGVLLRLSNSEKLRLRAE